MKEIGQFFNKFNSVAIIEIKKRELICDIIKKVIKQEINIEDISFSNRVIKIKGSPVFKSQILIKKDILIKKISEKIPNFIDIK